MLYFGEVVDNKDPQFLGRLKVRIFTKYDNVSDDMLPWAKNMNITVSSNITGGGNYSIPKIGSIVICKLQDNNHPQWYSQHELSESLIQKLKDNNLYDNGQILLWDDVNDIYIYHIDTFGLCIRTKSDDSDSNQIHITNDNVIQINNIYGVETLYTENELRLTHNNNSIIELNNNGISLGSKNKSSQPAVLGNDNADVLNSILNHINTLLTLITVYTKAQVAVGGAIPFLAPLIPALEALSSSVISLQTQVNSTKTKVPLTKSNKVTLD